MKTLKLIIALVALALAFTSCKKEKTPPEKKTEITGLDIKQYIITGTLLRTIGNKNFEHPYLITFDDNGVSTIYDWSANGSSGAKYTFSNGVLTIDYGGASNWVFTINKENITKVTGFQSNMLNQTLYKIPSTNQFTGNWYSGVLLSRENSSGLFFAYKFTDTQFQETVHVGGTNYNYTLIKNVMAIAPSAGTSRYFLALNGKLTVSVYNFGINPPANFFYGSLSKDQ